MKFYVLKRQREEPCGCIPSKHGSQNNECIKCKKCGGIIYTY